LRFPTESNIVLVGLCTLLTDRHLLNRSAVAEMGDNGHIDIWADGWGLLCPFPWGSWVPIYDLIQCGLYLFTKWHLDPFGHLTTIKQTLDKNWGCPLIGGAGSQSNTMSAELRPTSLPIIADWSIQQFGHNRHGPKSGGCNAFSSGEGSCMGRHLTQNRLN